MTAAGIGGGGDAWLSCLSPYGAGGGRSLWPRSGPLSGAANDCPRWPLRHGPRATGGRYGEEAFRATGSDLRPTEMWWAPRVVLKEIGGIF
jgi:hypothetical protein